MKIIPKITKLSHNKGSAYGNIIEIEGGGFSPDKKLTIVDIGGRNCSIIELSATKIKCRVPEFQIEEGSLFLGSPGLLYTKYNCTGYCGNHWQIRDLVWNNNSRLTERTLESGNLGQFEIYDTSGYQTAYWIRGYFNAPRYINIRKH